MSLERDDDIHKESFKAVNVSNGFNITNLIKFF